MGSFLFLQIISKNLYNKNGKKFAVWDIKTNNSWRGIKGNFIDNYYFYHKIFFGSHEVLCDLMNNAFIVKAKGVTHGKCNSLQKSLHS